MIQHLRVADNHHIAFPGKSNGRLNLNNYSNFSKIVIKGIYNLRKSTDCNNIIFDSSRNSIDRVLKDIIFLFLSKYF